MAEHHNIRMNDFSTIKVIGKGSYGKVILVRKRDTGELFAMKRLHKELLVRRNQIERTRAERNILERVKHPYVIKLMYAFQTTKKLNFILEYCPGGELFFHLTRAGRFDEIRTKFYSACILLALEHLHSLNIIYREQDIFSLKPENVLIDAEGFAKITDFGLSKENIFDNYSAKSFCGTPEYLAPEVVAKQGYGMAVDWWSLGCLIYEMLTGLPPFYHKEKDRMYRSIVYGNARPNECIPPLAWDLICKLLAKEANLRLGSGPAGADEIKQHRWFDDIDWNLMLQKRVIPPFIPRISHPLDLDNFDENFTRSPVSCSPNDHTMGSPDSAFPDFTYQPSEVTMEGV